MFSSTSSITPFANMYSSSFHHFSPPFSSGFDPNNVFLNNQLHDPFTTMALLDNITMTTTTNADDHHYCNGPPNLIVNKKPPPPPAAVKKDRHSKICTAQGLRDRRVRLSIDIAREFFDLQDMLGFDKASKTLEWLLSKSSKAIKELAQMKHTNHDNCLYSISDQNIGDMEGTAGKSSSGDHHVCDDDEKEMAKLDKYAILFQAHPARESRNKARARARQRTREKMCTRKLLHHPKKATTTTLDTTTSQILTHLSSQAPMQDVSDQESILLKRKLNPSSFFTHLDGSANSIYISDLPQNWDTSGAIIPHDQLFSAIANMNLPTTGFESCGRPCENHNNECPQH